jgi:hypothetical protein
MWTVNVCGAGCAQVIGDNAVTWETRGTVVSTSDGPACGSPTPITGNPVYIAMIPD